MDNRNIEVLYGEIDWLEEVIGQVIITYLQQEGHENSWEHIAVPDLTGVQHPYASVVAKWNLNKYQRLAIALAMAPHMRPQALDVFFGKNRLYDRNFTEFGTTTDKSHSGLLPTGQTLLFLIAGASRELWPLAAEILGKDSILIKEDLLVLQESETHLPRYSGVLTLNNHWVQYFLTGVYPAIENSAGFPAQRITTPMDWKDVVLESLVMQQVNDIINWIKHGDTLMTRWELHRKIKPGYRALFYGPPGTGKTLTATLIGKATGQDVYKVDLSMVVSKYIGETEKNLSRIFDVAQQKNFILFFDEADALFGKRTAAESSNDRHANQQTAYLLQRIEDFPGIIILASNLRANMDGAFFRRFQSVIHFSIPSAAERLQLWQNAFSGTCTLEREIDLSTIAREYEMAGGAIINVLRYCALSVISRNGTAVNRQELMSGIRKEYNKENRTVKAVI